MSTLKIITGPMFSGKTTELINEKTKLGTGITTLMINHLFDKRYSVDNHIVSHDNKKIDCIKISDILDVLNFKEFEDADFIFIDEAQFFNPKDLEHFVIECLFFRSKNIVIAGLNLNINMGDLGGLNLLFKYADEIKILRGECSFCDNKSFSNMATGVGAKTFSSDPIGFSNISLYDFKPVCKECWINKY